MLHHIHQYSSPNGKEHILEWYPDFWEGIGEILTRHDDLTALTYGEQARANHIALDPVYIFAAEHDLPVWVHSDISSVWIQEPIYLYEMEEVVERVLSFLQAFLGKKNNTK